MDTHYEIVNIINDKTLLSAESYEYAYRARNQGPLQPGVYLQIWRGHVEERHNGTAQYKGPFDSRAEAQETINRARPRSSSDFRSLDHGI